MQDQEFGMSCDLQLVSVWACLSTSRLLVREKIKTRTSESKINRGLLSFRVTRSIGLPRGLGPRGWSFSKHDKVILVRVPTSFCLSRFCALEFGAEIFRNWSTHELFNF